METYNRIMLFFWLLLAATSSVIITYMGFSEGFNRWANMYIIPIVAILMFIIKRWMVKRMKKHLEFLEQEKNKQA